MTTERHGACRRWAMALVWSLWAAVPALWAQAPGTTPVVVSHETQIMHGRKYYVHLVEKGQTVYSIAKAYKVESYDAVTHVDIHFLHPGDTVWLPCRGQFTAAATKAEPEAQPAATPRAEPPAEHRPQPKASPSPAAKQPRAAAGKPAVPAAQQPTQQPSQPPAVRKPGRVLKMTLMMPLHLDRIGEISTSKFDIEQRGKRSYKQFEFIEFYEGVQLALEQLAEEGISVELNVVDVADNSAAQVEALFESHHVAQSDVIVALLLREAFDRAAALAQQAGVYIVNPMATRSEICRQSPYTVKIQPSVEAQVAAMLANMKMERPEAHLYIIHSNAKEERTVADEVKRQLDERGDIHYTMFNWNQNAKLVSTIKNSPDCSVLSLYEQGRDLNRVYTNNLLNRLVSIKSHSPVLYTLTDWTHEYGDVDFGQLQQLNYHTFSTAWDMGNETHVEFLRRYRQRYATEPVTPLAATGHDMAVYIVRGLHRRGADFWMAPGAGVSDLTRPLRLVRSGEGLENDRVQLYRMTDFRMVPVPSR